MLNLKHIPFNETVDNAHAIRRIEHTILSSYREPDQIQCIVKT